MRELLSAVCVSSLAVLVSGCYTQETPSPGAGASSANLKYRYENRLDLGNDNTLQQVVVEGYDEKQLGEATRLDVSAGGAVLTLRNQVDVGGAMYTPDVQKSAQGNLLIKWSSIGEDVTTAELVADAANNLRVKKVTGGGGGQQRKCRRVRFRPGFPGPCGRLRPGGGGSAWSRSYG